MSASTLLDELRWRGLIHLASDGLQERLARRPTSGYIGFDASATSLHVGHLLQVFLLTHLQRAGGRPVIVIGGGTGMIGDPSGKSSERKLLDEAAIEANSAALRQQLERFLDFSAGPTQPRMVDNRDWLATMSIIDFLRDVGKHFRMRLRCWPRTRSRHAWPRAGMSFTEFSYQILQALGLLCIFTSTRAWTSSWAGRTSGATSPPASSSIRRVEGRPEGGEPSAFGLCSPLLLTRSGQKMGKSEKGAVFLDPRLTSPFDFYQYWVNDDDALVIDHLRWLTLLGPAEIDAIAAEHATRPEARTAQVALAHDLTSRIHGEAEAERQAGLADAAFATEVGDPDVLAGLFEALEHFEFGAEADTWTALDVAVAASRSSRAEARRLVGQGGLSINGQRQTDPTAAPPGLIAGRWWWVALGRKRHVVGRRSEASP